MKTIYFLENLYDWNACRTKQNGEYHLLDLDRFQEATGSNGTVGGFTHASRLSDKRDIEKKYLDLIARLGKKLPAKLWWASALSEKNPLNHKIFIRLYNMLLACKHIDTDPRERIIIVSSDPCLLEQLYENLKGEHAVHISKKILWRKRITDLLGYGLGILKLLVRSATKTYQSILCRLNLGERAQKLRDMKECIVIRTWLDQRNYLSGRFEDPYFKKLCQYLRKENIVIFAGVIKNYSQALQAIKNDAHNHIVPTNMFLKISDIFQALGETFFSRIRFDEIKQIRFEGIGINKILEEELRQDITTPLLFYNLLEYYGCLRLAQNVSIERFIYTYENYGWEKMSLIALKDVDPNIKTLGFQHAFISRNSFKYFPSTEERDQLPLPDRIVTMGRRTKEMMERSGGYPGNRLVEGCALRQDYINERGILERNKEGDIFVPLTITVDDTIKTIRFLYEAGLGRYDRKVILRFHPATPVKIVKRRLGFELPKNFIISENPPIIEEIKRCSIVIYTWTTVALEALKMGRPVIYLDVNFPLEVDPLFECEHLKDQCFTPEELVTKIARLNGLNDQVFNQELDKAQQYLSDYFLPVNESSCAVFASD